MNDAAMLPVAECLRVIAHGMHQRKLGGDPTRAAQAFFAAAAMAAQRIPADAGQPQDIRALALYNVSLIQLRQGDAEESRRMRERAAELLSPDCAPEQLPSSLVPLFQELMADTLADLGEFRRAIPYCEAVIQHVGSLQDPVAAAEVLWRAGKCYERTGMRDHAAVPLRAAVKIFRTLAGDPRLPAVLINLGNALRKSTPDEAERCYKEVAEIHIARAQLESAAPAWVNLGVMCSEQGRYGEALAHYEQALRIREQSPGTPAERIGTLLNNIAGAHRRMSNFNEALRFIDRATQLLEPRGGYPLACAYGTRALIFRDQGRDEDAVEWFRKSAAEHEAQVSPNLETLSEELENEAAALTRLGRLEEAAIAQHKLESVRVTMSSIGGAKHELADTKLLEEGAVLVELDFGSRVEGRQDKHAAMNLERELAALVAGDGTGWLGGHVLIPETTTFMFYGEDADLIFLSLEPALRAEPLCAGARVTIRQGVSHREVLLPRQVM